LRREVHAREILVPHCGRQRLPRLLEHEPQLHVAQVAVGNGLLRLHRRPQAFAGHALAHPRVHLHHQAVALARRLLLSHRPSCRCSGPP
jgi:hypothetical protein